MSHAPANSTQPVRLFVSYSHEDQTWCKRLRPLLKVKANVTELKPWHDTEIQAGDLWDKEIRDELERMDIFLCLVSYDFLASDYIRKIELSRAQERHALGQIEVVPVLLYEMDLRADCPFLFGLNPLPGFGKFWSAFELAGDSKNALFPIGNGIKQAIEKVQARRSK